MDPGSVLLRDRHGFAEGVEGASVDLSGLKADDCRRRRTRQGSSQGSSLDAPFPVGVDLDDALLAQPEESHGAVDGIVPVTPYEHPGRRRTVA